MPIVSTIGSMSSRGFGFGGAAKPDSKSGIFALGKQNLSGGGGSVVNTREKYTFATCTSTTSGVGTASAAALYGAASSNGSRGIFAIGCTESAPTPVTTRNKYLYSNCSSTACGVAASSAGSREGSATGNSTRGIFAIGLSSGAKTTTRNKYTYSNCTSTACGVGAASTASSAGSAAGESTKGIFALGSITGFPYYVTTRNKYTYSTCASTACGVGAASTNSGAGAAAGNSTRGIFALGYNPGSCCSFNPSQTRNKYTYSTCASTSSGVASSSAAMAYGAAVGNSTRGIFSIARPQNFPTNTRDKYTYAACTSTSCGVGTASISSFGQSGAWWATCVNCGI